MVFSQIFIFIIIYLFDDFFFSGVGSSVTRQVRIEEKTLCNGRGEEGRGRYNEACKKDEAEAFLPASFHPVVTQKCAWNNRNRLSGAKKQNLTF